MVGALGVGGAHSNAGSAGSRSSSVCVSHRASEDVGGRGVEGKAGDGSGVCDGNDAACKLLWDPQAP